MSGKELPEGLLKYWQDVLGLNDWRIKLILMHPDELDALGWCGQTEERRVGTLRLAEPRFTADDEDWEVTLVHELLHLYFPLKSLEGYERVRAEQGIDLIATLLVAAHHEEEEVAKK